MRSREALSRFSLLLAALLLFFSPALAGAASAHDLPLDVLVNIYAKPQGHTLRMLVRMPLKSVQDAEYPRKAQGYVDLAKADPFLRDALRLAMLDSSSMSALGQLLPLG